MTDFNEFAWFGTFYPGVPSPCEQVYKATRAAMTDPKTGRPVISLTVGTADEAKVYADSCVLGAALARAYNAGLEAEPESAEELLPLHEAQYKLVPKATDSVRARQLNAAARKKGTRGARRESVHDAVRTLLGSDFLGYRVLVDGEFTPYPADATLSTELNAVRAELPPKFLQLTEPVVNVGAPLWFPYENLDTQTAEVLLLKGDVVMVEAESSAQGERVTILDVRGSGSTREFQAEFLRPHSARATITTADHPWEWSTARFVMFVLAESAALSPEKRRKLNELAERLMRAVTQWAIVRPTSAGVLTVGPFSITSPLGCVPIGTLAFTLAP